MYDTLVLHYNTFIRTNKRCVCGDEGVIHEAPYRRLCRGQVAAIEDEQANDTADKASTNQYPWIPVREVVFGECLCRLHVVERFCLEHPVELVGEATERVHQVAQEDDTYCRPTCCSTTV